MRLFLPYLSAVLLAAAFLNYHLGFLALFGLVPLLVYIHTSRKSKRLLLHSWLAGCLFFGTVMLWVVFINGGLWQNFDPLAIRLLASLIWIVSVLALSVGWLLPIFIITVPKRLDLLSKKALLIVPAAWVVGEFVRSWLFSLVWFGRGASLGAHWNFGNLGLGLASTPLLHFSRLGGLFGLCFMAVLINLVCLWFIKGSRLFASGVTIGILCMLMLSYRIYSGGPVKQIQVGVIQLPPGKGLNFLQDAQAKVAQQSTPLNLLVLPEYAELIDTNRSTLSDPIIKEAFKNQLGAAVYSRLQTNYRAFNTSHSDQLEVVDQQNQVLSNQAKRFLIPTGEYMPYLAQVLAHLTGQGQALQTFNNQSAVQPGNSPNQIVNYQQLKIGALVCSGVISPYLYQNLAHQGANVLTNSASLTVFDGSPFYFQQAKAMARFQAVANNLPFLQATQGGYSYIIDHNGHFVRETKTRQLEYLHASADIGHRHSLYSLRGEYFALISIVICGVYVWLALQRR